MYLVKIVPLIMMMIICHVFGREINKIYLMKFGPNNLSSHIDCHLQIVLTYRLVQFLHRNRVSCCTDSVGCKSSWKNIVIEFTRHLFLVSFLTLPILVFFFFFFDNLCKGRKRSNWCFYRDVDSSNSNSETTHFSDIEM